jgi:hypothetical protein
MKLLDKIRFGTERTGRKTSSKSLDIGKSEKLESIVDSYDSVREDSGRDTSMSNSSKKKDLY